MIRNIIILLACLAASRAFGQPKQVLIIRHAEKVNDSLPGLSERGRERAAVLVPYFLEREEVTKHKPIVAVYCQKTTTEQTSERPFRTVEPLAAALKKEVRQFPRDEEAKMVKEILEKKEYSGGTVVICWSHDDIPKIAKSLGVDDNDAKEWKGKNDRTWAITFRKGEKPKFKDLPQRLLFEDSKD